LHDVIAEGEEMVVRGPRNNFPLAHADSYIFIAGGIGITPLLPMISEAERKGLPWKLHYAGKSKSSMAFLAELDRFGNRVALWPKDENKRMDLSQILGLPQQATLVYCCGPESLLDGIAEAMKHWPEESLRVERFTPKQLGEPVRTTTFEVELARSQKVITVSPEQSILEAVNAEGVDVLSSCKQGTCGSCETRVIAGTPDHRDSVLSEKAQSVGDTMMICVSRSCGDRLTLDL
jgi:ferredoxin-NADP reductase